MWLCVFSNHVVQYTMDRFINVITNQVEHAKGVLLSNSEQQLRQA